MTLFFTDEEFFDAEDAVRELARLAGAEIPDGFKLPEQAEQKEQAGQ